LYQQVNGLQLLCISKVNEAYNTQEHVQVELASNDLNDWKPIDFMKTKQPYNVVVMIPQAKDLFSRKKPTKSKNEDESKEEEENVTFLGAEYTSPSAFDCIIPPPSMF